MTAIIVNSKERTRFLRFAVVGIIGAVVDFGLANILVKVVSAPLVIAGTISFIAAILSNFTWNRYWTYPDSRSKPLVQQLVQFFFVSVAGLAIRVPILAFLEPFLFKMIQKIPIKPPLFSLDFLSKNITLAIAVIIVMFWNFFINRYWTYSDVKD